MASVRSLYESSLRPCVQVSISVNMKMPMTIGNQPPPNSFNRFEAKNMMSMTKKKPVAAAHSASG